MPKQRTNKTVEKRMKITASGKMLRRHQMGTSHLKRKKSKGAINRQKKLQVVHKTMAKKYRRLMSI